MPLFFLCTHRRPINILSTIWVNISREVFGLGSIETPLLGWVGASTLRVDSSTLSSHSAFVLTHSVCICVSELPCWCHLGFRPRDTAQAVQHCLPNCTSGPHRAHKNLTLFHTCTQPHKLSWLARKDKGTKLQIAKNVSNYLSILNANMYAIPLSEHWKMDPTYSFLVLLYTISSL